MPAHREILKAINTFPVPVRRPVRRHKAANYLLALVISFCVAVVFTRLFLTLTGFPKIGTGELHIAHLLWGGLLLFVSSLLLLILSNQWVYTLGALLSGVGVGLFIDEVGKFITQSNDYFYPFAIPIIYSVILITVLIYLQVRRPESDDPRAEMYRALETLQELLDRDLDVHERTELDQRLRRIAAQPLASDTTRLAQVLLTFVEGSSIQLAPLKNDLLTRLTERLRAFASNRVGRQHLRAFISIGLIIVGGAALAELVILILATRSPDYLEQLTRQLESAGLIRGAASLQWFFLRLAIEGAVGLLLLIGSVLLILGRDRRGHELGYIGLLLSLTIVNLLIFYFDQFGNIVLTLVEAALLLSMIVYRRRYLMQKE